MRNRNYGNCDYCGTPLEAELFWEEERNEQGHLTGRIRRAVGMLYCPHCMKKYCIDDTFDGSWFYPSGGLKGYEN